MERDEGPRAKEFMIKIQPTTVKDSPRHHAINTDKPRTRSRIKYLFVNLVAPVILVIVAHYLVVVKFNLDYNYLRGAAILIPLSAGFFTVLVRRTRSRGRLPSGRGGGWHVRRRDAGNRGTDR